MASTTDAQITTKPPMTPPMISPILLLVLEVLESVLEGAMVVATATVLLVLLDCSSLKMSRYSWMLRRSKMSATSRMLTPVRE